MSVDDITPYDKNARVNDKAVDAVAKSIEEYGFKNPILIDKDGVIICGHTRLKGAKKLGYKEVPCVYADDLTPEQVKAFRIARDIYSKYPTDGKYILASDKMLLIICQSNANADELQKDYVGAIINPLGYWTGGTDVDTGATNRKLGSDMADSVTGGGLHGKDLSKADVSVNIYAFKKAQETGKVVNICCAIGDTHIDGKPYSDIVEEARRYINDMGGFEKFAEWGLY